MEAAQKKKSLKRLVFMILAELTLVAFFVVFFDPFYQYHEPVLGMEAVLNDRDNQMPGTIRNFEYDSVLVGSSVAENFDSSVIDEAYGCNTIKLIRASGSCADLLYYLEGAQAEQELKNVFWCLDLFALNASTEITLTGEEIPRYLHTESVLDDIPYVFNKEVILEKIPYMLAGAMQGINTGGKAYDWSRGKNFGADWAMLAYEHPGFAPGTEIAQKDFSSKKALIEENIQMLAAQVESTPRIQYRFLIPPYSMLWWDCAYVNGELQERLFILKQAMKTLISYENVEIYFFQSEDTIVCDLDNYMDMIHYSPEINQYMLEKMIAGENRVTSKNLTETLRGMEELANRISQEEIFRYYEPAK